MARSFIRAAAPEMGIHEKEFENNDFHVHVPSGSIPKDGPSAGVTMLTAIVSLLTGIKVDPTIAMTGEATLRGAVLPVGGIKEKVLAAHRAGIKTVLLPEKNRKDLVEVPEEIQSELEFVFCGRMEEVLHRVLGKAELKRKSADLATRKAAERATADAKKNGGSEVKAEA